MCDKLGKERAIAFLDQQESLLNNYKKQKIEMPEQDSQKLDAIATVRRLTNPLGKGWGDSQERQIPFRENPNNHLEKGTLQPTKGQLATWEHNGNLLNTQSTQLIKTKTYKTQEGNETQVGSNLCRSTSQTGLNKGPFHQDPFKHLHEQTSNIHNETHTQNNTSIMGEQQSPREVWKGSISRLPVSNQDPSEQEICKQGAEQRKHSEHEVFNQTNTPQYREQLPPKKVL